jgi:RNA polymerase sigma-70 factor (ECF subfamily)
MYSDSSDGPDDQELVQRVRRGNQEAFTELFRRYNEPLCGYILCIVGNHDDMQDIAQQTYEKVYTFLRTSSEEVLSFKGLLYTTAKNTTKDYCRAKQRRPPPSRGSPQEDREDIGPMVEELAIQAELLVLAWEETQKKLTFTQMQCFIWHHEGVEIEEIARRLRLSKKTVRTYLSKVYPSLRQAYRRLQSHLEEEE